MDQAAPAHQGLLRHQRERGQDADMDRVSAYVLVAIVRKRLAVEASLYKSYRCSVLPYSRKRPFYGLFRRSTAETTYQAKPTN